MSKSSEWIVHALHGLKEFCKHNKIFAIEDFRRVHVEYGVPEPEHHNSWGALAATAQKEELIRPTGEYRPARSSRTHGHRVIVWEAV